MVCPPQKPSRTPLVNGNTFMIPPAAFVAAQRQFFLNRPPLGLPFQLNPSVLPNQALNNISLQAPINQLPSSTIFPSLFQQQALLFRQFQQHQFNHFLQKLEETRSSKTTKAPETVSQSASHSLFRIEDMKIWKYLKLEYRHLK